MTTKEVTQAHEDLFRKIVQLRREIGLLECTDATHFSYDLNRMQDQIEYYERQVVAERLLKKFKGDQQ